MKLRWLGPGKQEIIVNYWAKKKFSAYETANRFHDFVSFQLKLGKQSTDVGIILNLGNESTLKS